MPSEVFYECCKDLELFEKLCKEDIMDEKRFIVDGLTIAENSPKGRKYLLEYQGGVNALCSRINGLFDKSKRLEKENEKLKNKLKFFNELNKPYGDIIKENEQLKKENTMLKEHQNINCQNCQYFVSDSASSDCLKREDIGYKGTCIDGIDLHKLAKNCPYY